MPRKAGAQNNKKEVLLEVMVTFLPNQGSNSWEQVAAAYQEKSCESELRDKEDLKRHWREKCCNKFKKPTGKSGTATEFILKCQRVQLLIHKKNELSLLGDDLAVPVVVTKRRVVTLLGWHSSRRNATQIDGDQGFHWPDTGDPTRESNPGPIK